jgi:integrase/recombinase XerD
MSSLAPTLEAFFAERLLNQRRASPHTVAAYRDSLRLLLAFLQNTTGKAPSQLQFEDLNAPAVGAFLDHLEHDRGVVVSTRNARLTAIRSLFRFAALRHPEHAALIQRVLAIPSKRIERNIVSFLARPEIDALLATPDRSTWVGRRDHALLLVAIQTGLRVSELTGLRRGDVELGTGAHLRCRGKGRKERCTPVTAQSVAVLRAWLRDLGGTAGDPLFPGPHGSPLGRDTVRKLVIKHAGGAAHRCPSIGENRSPTHLEAHRCHAASAGRRRHLGDRAVPRPRNGPDHLHLPAC